MQFAPAKNRKPPGVIIVSLVDVLMVVLIFMVVSTTFKDSQAFINLAASSEADGHQQQNLKPLVITVPENAENILLDGSPFQIGQIERELKERLQQTPNLQVSIEADGKADFEIIVKIRDAAKSAGVKNLNAFVQEGPVP
ncbi:MAG: hypothetical protein CMO74_01635 [Verrucomicrobiales bacterium]|nr:hypothetical protein [Verrucomicrobiales bacterium]|tara:strand:- start:13174 stop:13593 length:420 start_codon:yes stop_codon:yes gene_type:complete